MAKEFAVKVGIGLAMVAGGTYMLNKGATETYQLQEADQPVFSACKRGFKGNDVEPKAASVSVYDACACIAKHATAELDASQLSAYSDTQKALITLGAASLDNSDLTDAEIEDALDPERIMKRHEMDELAYMEVTMLAMTHQSVCLAEDSHEGETLERIAAMRPKDMPVQNVEYREPVVETASTDVLSGLRR